MKLKILIALFAILCFHIAKTNTQSSSSVFDIVETDDQKGAQAAGKYVII
jgi:thioredoxin-related protein